VQFIEKKASLILPHLRCSIFPETAHRRWAYSDERLTPADSLQKQARGIPAPGSEGRFGQYQSRAGSPHGSGTPKRGLVPPLALYILRVMVRSDLHGVCSRA
jgi:hypothetical protein